MPTPLEILFDPVSLGLLALFGLAIIVERLFPARQLPAVTGWLPRSLAAFAIYFYLSTYLPLIWDQYLVGFQLLNLSSLNDYVSTLITLLVFELMIYIWHRSLHRRHWLWRSCHQLHHSAERLDSFGAFYFSPLDMIGFTFVGSLSLSVVVGMSAQAISLFLFTTFFLGLFQHLNVKTPRWLGYIIQRPESHSVHHAKGVHGYNYSDLPLFDILFGTFSNPKEFATECGFYPGASSKVREMLLFRDVSNEHYADSVSAPGVNAR